MFESGWIVFVKPVGEQLVQGSGLEDVSRHNVRSQLTSLFEQDDSELLIAGFVCELLEADCSSETCGTF
jgi:hypothetical protein